MSRPTMTKPQLRREWVDALRSGKYAQATSSLCTLDPETREPTGFDCLGVACEVFRKHFPDELKITFRDRGRYIDVQYDGDDAFLPDRVRDAFGIRHDDGESDYGPTLVARNDRGFSFSEIADFIESNPSGLFTDNDGVAQAPTEAR